ncbi:unnamed protein product [Callosobruchus maculatus]|uniref:Uncharacterized protein n=1 Tax=Callosobruchus maculatus TaxID=64391 RepID=A0A653BJ41_CALMS|nr:unnamed protein product [Callosobruchus maculatus]
MDMNYWKSNCNACRSYVVTCEVYEGHRSRARERA